MADNLHKLAIQIQGDIDARFGDSIKEMTGHLKQLEDGVKSVAESRIKPDAISGAFIRVSREAGMTAQALNGLNLQMRQTDGYAKQRKETAEAAQKLRGARNEVRRLEAAQKESGTKEFAKQLKAAQKEAVAAERAYNKQKSTLTALGGKLRASGIDAGNLAEEQKRLAGEIESTSEKSKKFEGQLARLTRGKFHFDQLRGHVKKLGADLLWGIKIASRMGLAAGGAAFGLFKVVDSVAAAGDAVDETAQKLHMSAEAFQELQYAAERSGVKDFGAQMQRFNANLAKAANGQGEGAKIFKELGLNAKQFSEMKPEAALQIFADELNKIKDPSQRARSELALFGKTGAEMGVFLKTGSSGMKEMMQRARELGFVISDEAASQAGAFNDARDDMKATFTGLKNIIGIELIPVFTDMFGSLSTFFVENQDVVKDFATNLGGKFREILPTLEGFGTGAVKIIGIMWDVGKVVTNLVGGVENLGMIVAALPLLKTAATVWQFASSLGGLITSLVGVARGIGLITKVLFANPIGIAIAAIAGAAFLIYKYWEPIKGFFLGLWEGVKAAAAGARDFIATGWNGLSDLIASALTGIAEVIAVPFRAGYAVVQGIIGYFKGDFADLPSALKDIFASVKEIITKPFGDAFAWVGSKWASLKDWLGVGPTINADMNVAEIRGTGGRARGGRQDTPALIPFAERGAEVAVPLGLADRSHGIASLNMASRGMGLGDVVRPTNMEDRMKNVPSVQSRPVSVKATFPLPPINVTVYGGDPEAQRRTMIDVMREVGASLIPEWQAEIARVAYVTG